MTPAEITSINTREHDLFHPCSGDVVYMCQGIGDGSTSAAPARQRNRAERAEVVAAILDFQERAGPIVGIVRGHEVLEVLDGCVMCGSSRPFVAQGLGHALIDVGGEVEFLVGSQHKVYSGYLGNLFGLQLGVATHHGNEGFWVDGAEPPHMPTTFLVGILRYATGVEYEYIGPICLPHFGIASLLQRPGQGAGFAEVELAAQGVKSGGAGGAQGSIVGFEVGWFYHLSSGGKGIQVPLGGRSLARAIPWCMLVGISSGGLTVFF